MSHSQYILLFFQPPDMTEEHVQHKLTSPEKQFVEYYKYSYIEKLIPEKDYNQSRKKCTEIIKKDYQETITADYVLIEFRSIDNSKNFQAALTKLRKDHYKNTQHDYRLHFAAPILYTHPPKITDCNLSLSPINDLDKY